MRARADAPARFAMLYYAGMQVLLHGAVVAAAVRDEMVVRRADWTTFPTGRNWSLIAYHLMDLTGNTWVRGTQLPREAHSGSGHVRTVDLCDMHRSLLTLALTLGAHGVAFLLIAFRMGAVLQVDR